MISDLIRKNRTCRRFYEEHEIDHDTLKGLVNLARLSASAANLQPLKYILSNHRETNAHIFECLGWAGYLSHWPGPPEGERPSAYIVILGDTRISRQFGCDHGIAAQSMMLGAREKGLAGSLIGTIKTDRLCSILDIPDHLEVLLVLALGKPKEKITIEPVGEDGSIRYWRDEKAVHHVPKRSLDDIIVRHFP